MQDVDGQDPFRALADPTRRDILALLHEGPRPVRELAASFPQMSRPAVSKHLRVLRHAGLVAETKSGRRRIYRLRREALDEVDRWLSGMQVAPGVHAAGAKREAKPARRRATRRRGASPARASKTGVGGAAQEKPRPKGGEEPHERGAEEVFEDPAPEIEGDWKSW